ncbi:TPA: LamG domain-containing protein [Candidatus Poribacteria bacterium]|nr:LamG domain-containing protein [Candidatus Poribacteria bacterium]HEX29743.1 LamG domain-containing protein [Candidatus Poribacteria bacterium]
MRKDVFSRVMLLAGMLIFTLPCWSDLQNGLVGYWPMDEGNGDKVKDVSGNGHDGTAKNTKWVDGKYGKALEFNGVDSIVDIPYSQEMTPKEGATIAAWVFPTDTTRSCIFGQFEGYGMALFTGLKLKSVIWGDDWVSDVTIPVEQWSHVAMTWDVKSGNRRMFLNGKLVDEKGGAKPIPNVQNHFGIGLWVGWPAAWGDDMFKGIIDEVRFWNRVLSEGEIGQATQPAAVEPSGKLPLIWGKVKSR